MTDFESERESLAEQLISRGIKSERVLNALASVPRECFVPADFQAVAYDDRPLPIGEGQTISQPYIVAFMIDALQLSSTDRVLEIGSGSGYAAAVLAQIASEVFTVERIETLATKAREVLETLNYKNVFVQTDDGTNGWEQRAPYDSILVSACGPTIPKQLIQQLKIGGRLVMPVGAIHESQELLYVVRTSEDKIQKKTIAAVRFVPLIGKSGWKFTNC